MMTWLAVDGNSWYAADWYASANDGKRAIDNMVKRLRDIVKQMKPERVVVAFDGGTSWRRSVIAEYKAHRRIKPDGYHVRLDECVETIGDLAGVEAIRIDGFEADDVVAAIAKQAIADESKLVICSSDKDLHQLLVEGQITQATKITRPGPSALAPTFTTAKGLREKLGVWPHQWVDYRVVVGDPSDYLAGCPTIGEASAKLLFTKRTDSLDSFWKNPFAYALTDRQRTALINFRERAELLRQVVRLRADCLEKVEA